MLEWTDMPSLCSPCGVMCDITNNLMFIGRSTYHSSGISVLVKTTHYYFEYSN